MTKQGLGFIEIDDVGFNTRIFIRASSIQVVSPRVSHEDAKAIIGFDNGASVETSLTVDEIFNRIADIPPSAR